MSEWSAEWWKSNASPLLEAFKTLDYHTIVDALWNIPYAYMDYVVRIFRRSPEHVIIETFLILFILYVTFVKKSYDPSRVPSQLKEEEIDALCEEWEPEPLVPVVDQKVKTKAQIEATPYALVENTPSTKMKIQGIDNMVLNMATFDFLGLGSRSELKKVSRDALLKYGCGSCGPRGFYGTIDTHEALERQLAAFMQTPDAVLYSDSEATVSSVISAFAKRGDLIVVDEGCNNAIAVGVNLSRASVLRYKHNDLKDLESVLVGVIEKDKKMGRRSDCQRRYIVTEAIFRNYGDMIDLPKILDLCNKYFFRLLLDESNSFMVLGATGRGITEHFKVDISEVEIICASLAAASASVGGFSVGSQEVVDYQRLNSAGYVFSAAAPPFCSASCMEALDIARETPKLYENLRKNTEFLHEQLCKKFPKACVLSCPLSPIAHLTFEAISQKRGADAFEIYHSIMMQCLKEKNVAVTACRSDPKTHSLCTLRFTISALHTTADIEKAITAVAAVVNKVL